MKLDKEAMDAVKAVAYRTRGYSESLNMDTEDMEQELVVGLLSAREPGPEIPRKAWVCSVLRNRLCNIIREIRWKRYSHTKAVVTEEYNPIDDAEYIDKGFAEVDLRLDVEDAINKLDSSERGDSIRTGRVRDYDICKALMNTGVPADAAREVGLARQALLNPDGRLKRIRDAFERAGLAKA